MKRIIPAIIVIAALAVIAFQHLPKEEVYFSREYTSQGFKVRWEVRDAGILIRDLEVVFKSAAAGSDRWREIVTGWTDEPHAYPSDDHVRFLDARTGYVFIRGKYAVTRDGGATWSVWDAADHFPPQRTSWVYIDKVEMGPDGHGSMRLSLTGDGPSPITLRTSDYGLTWRSE